MIDNNYNLQKNIFIVKLVRKNIKITKNLTQSFKKKK